MATARMKSGVMLGEIRGWTARVATAAAAVTATASRHSRARCRAGCMAQMYAAPAGMLLPGRDLPHSLAGNPVVGWGVTSKRAAMERGRRQARLRPEYAVLYPGVPSE